MKKATCIRHLSKSNGTIAVCVTAQENIPAIPHNK